MNTETALAHLEAFIAGGDELGDVPEDDAVEALQSIRETLEKLQKALENLLEACYLADAVEELSDYVDGSLLDAASDALKGGE